MLAPQVYNLHRSPYFWDEPDKFNPERFTKAKPSDGIEKWAGFDPTRGQSALYPNEVNCAHPITVSDYHCENTLLAFTYHFLGECMCTSKQNCVHVKIALFISFIYNLAHL